MTYKEKYYAERKLCPVCKGKRWGTHLRPQIIEKEGDKDLNFIHCIDCDYEGVFDDLVKE